MPGGDGERRRQRRASERGFRSGSRRTLGEVGDAVAARPVDEQNGEDEHDGFPDGEEERERLADHPGDRDEERDDKEGDLDRRADGDREREVDLVLDRDGDGRDVLGRIADEREEDEGDKLARDAAVGREAVDRADQELGRHAGDDDDDEEDEEGLQSRGKRGGGGSASMTGRMGNGLKGGRPTWIAVSWGISNSSSSSSDSPPFSRKGFSTSGTLLSCGFGPARLSGPPASVSASEGRRERTEAPDEEVEPDELEPKCEGTQVGRRKTCDEGGEGPAWGMAASSRRRWNGVTVL